MTLLIEECLKLETKVWEALKSGDAVLASNMLANNFLGLYPTGFATGQDHCDQLKNGPTVSTYEIINPRLVELVPDMVLLAYLAQWSRITDGHPGKPERMYISSIWQRFGQEWKNIFSQDTPAAGDSPG